MENEIIIDENSRKADLCDKVIGKLSGEQILKLAAIGVGGILSFAGILCLNGYDFSLCDGRISVNKHDACMSRNVA